MREKEVFMSKSKADVISVYPLAKCFVYNGAYQIVEGLNEIGKICRTEGGAWISARTWVAKGGKLVKLPQKEESNG